MEGVGSDIFTARSEPIEGCVQAIFEAETASPGRWFDKLTMSGLESNNPLVLNLSKDAHKPRSGPESVSAQVVVLQAHHERTKATMAG